MNAVRVEVRTAGSGVHIKMPSEQAKSQPLYNILPSMTSVYLHRWCTLHVFKQRLRVKALSDILPCRHKDTLFLRQTLALFPVNRRPHLQPEQAWHAAMAVLGVSPWVPGVLERAGPWQGFVSLMGLTSLSLHNTDEDKEATQCGSAFKAFPMQVSKKISDTTNPPPHTHTPPLLSSITTPSPHNTERSRTAGADTCAWVILVSLFNCKLIRLCSI